MRDTGAAGRQPRRRRLRERAGNRTFRRTILLEMRRCQASAYIEDITLDGSGLRA